MAAVAGISEASVRRIWHSHGLKPHRVETFKLSNDPRSPRKLEDIVGPVSESARACARCCHWTRRARSKLLTVPSPACP